MKFNYQARDKQGQIQAGVVEASSREAALNLLQGYGLFVTVLERVDAPPIYAKRIKIFEQVNQKELVLFSRQLSIMFKSEVTLLEALKVLSSQSKNLNFKEKLLTLVEDVEGGTAFSKALARYPKFFNPLYTSMVKSGEVSGKLADVLDYLADHLERAYHLRSKIRGAMAYPVVIIFVAIAVLVVMSFFIIPNLSKMLQETGQELPLVTRGVIGLTKFIRIWGWMLAIMVGGLFAVIFRYYKSKEGKRVFDKLFLKIPLMGQFLKMIYLSRFAENLSTLISGGLPIAQALEITGNIIGNSVYKDVITKSREGVRRGIPISSVLWQHVDVFPPMFCQMTLVGEKTGALDKTLMNVVLFYQKEVDRTIDIFLSVLEPVLILFLGVGVAGLMAAVLLPLYKVMAI